MKTYRNAWLRLLSVVSLLSAVPLAWAYYDPGVQRWINRDPIGEVGLSVVLSGGDPNIAQGDWPNLFTLVLNNPSGFTDSFGLEVYKSCKEDKTQGGFTPTRSVPTGRHLPLPGGGDAEEMRVI